MPSCLWEMITVLTAWPLAGVAVYSVLAAWFRGSIFESPRYFFEGWRDDPKAGVFHHLIGDLFTCPFCLSYHAAFWIVLYAVLTGVMLTSPVVLFLWFGAQSLGHALFQITDRN